MQCFCEVARLRGCVDTLKIKGMRRAGVCGNGDRQVVRSPKKSGKILKLTLPESNKSGIFVQNFSVFLSDDDSVTEACVLIVFSES